MLIKHKILRFLSEIIKIPKNIEMQTILEVCTPTIDIEPQFNEYKYSYYDFKKIKNSELAYLKLFQSFYFGWAGGIRTHACQSQSLVPYRLATAQYINLMCCKNNGVEDGTRTHGLQCHKLAR